MTLRRDPIVSVSLVTYNHERYVTAAIESILGQSLADLELIIVDDGSTDATPQRIAAFRDPRVVAIRQRNKGPGAATNCALAECRGRYVALMSGDDVAASDRLERQLAFYESGPRGFLFSGCEFIDEDGAPVQGAHFAKELFDLTPRSRGEMFRRFFFEGNFINSVTGFTETAIFGELGPYDPTLYQLQDYEMWIRVVKAYPIRLMGDRLLKYRIHRDGHNLSSPSTVSLFRHETETALIMRRFFAGVPIEFFRDAFGADLRKPEIQSAAQMACEQALLYLDSQHPRLQMIGIERVHDLLVDSEAGEVLEREYGLSPQWFAERLRQFDAPRPLGPSQSTLFLDTGAGFNEHEAIERHPARTARLLVEYDLGAPGPEVKALRWDPLEGRLCRVRLERVTWRDGAGVHREVRPVDIGSNGTVSQDGTHVFTTIDPMFFLPVRGSVSAVCVEGEWWIDDAEASLARMERALAETGSLRWRSWRVRWRRSVNRLKSALRSLGLPSLPI